MREIDLHVHTNISDGSESPAETVRYAHELGLRAIAITDHDSVNGVAEAQRAGKEYGVEVVAGMELGCGWYGREVHMLGYDLDIHSKKLPPVLDWIVRDRDERNRKMVDMLAKDGLFIDLDELQAKHPGSTIGRPHFALCMVEAGVAESVKDAFERFLDPGCKYYIRRHFLSVEDASAREAVNPSSRTRGSISLRPSALRSSWSARAPAASRGLSATTQATHPRSSPSTSRPRRSTVFVPPQEVTGTAKISRTSTSAAA